MRNTKSMRFALAVLIEPTARDPVAGKRDVSRHLKGSRLKVACFERQTLAGLRRNPFGNVIFADWCGADRWPAQEIFMP